MCSTGYNGITANKVGIFQLDQAKALYEFGYDVRIATIDIRSLRRRRHYGSYCYKLDGITISTSNFPYGRLPFSSLKGIIAQHCARKAYGLITKDGWKPEIIHAHFGELAAAFADIAKENSIPFVVTEHSSSIHKDKVEKNIIKTAKKAYQVADQLIAVSESLANSMYKVTGHRAMVIPNIVDTKIFSIQKRKEQAHKFTFVSAGHLELIKGMDILLKAYKKCKYVDTELVILGDGSERNKLKSLAKELNLESRVFFKGEYIRQEFQNELENADCFVLASRGETFGVVYIEAMAAGVPVIGTLCGGPNDIIIPEVGLLVPPENIDSLSSAMDYMYKHKNDYDSRFISNYSKSKYGKKEIVKRLQDIYKKVIKKNE